MPEKLLTIQNLVSTYLEKFSSGWQKNGATKIELSSAWLLATKWTKRELRDFILIGPADVI